MKILTRVFVISLFLISASIPCLASLGVSPGALIFPNMLRGGFAQRQILISTLSEPINVQLNAGGEIDSWIEFSRQNLTVLPNISTAVSIVVRPPADIPNGNYSGFVTVFRTPMDNSQNITGIGNVVVMSVRVPITVEVTDRESKKCRAYSFSIDSVEQGSQAKLRMVVINDGNVKMSSPVRVDIWDQQRTSIVKFQQFSTPNVLPTLEQAIDFSLSVEQLPTGQYWAEISVPECDAYSIVTFDILEKGALLSKGSLLQIINEPWISVGQTAKIEAIFKNEGARSVLARFKGTVSYQGQLVSVLESDEVEVPAGATESLITYFKPALPGSYTIEGRVYYGKKVTFPASSIINVKESQRIHLDLITLIYIMILIASLVLLFLIFRRHRKRMRKRLF
ncbi:MAG: hypothetical protein QW471_04160 [Candidatus Woesearchaeota archaeon]